MQALKVKWISIGVPIALTQREDGEIGYELTKKASSFDAHAMLIEIYLKIVETSFKHLCNVCLYIFPFLELCKQKKEKKNSSSGFLIKKSKALDGFFSVAKSVFLPTFRSHLAPRSDF